VAGRGLEGLAHVLQVGVVGPGHEGGLGRDREAQRVQGPLERAQGRALGRLALLRRGRVLALRQPVDPVVEEEDLQVDVAADRVQEVVAADREAVAVTGDDEDRQVGPGDLEPRGDRRRAAVDRVEAVGVHVVREAARAADPRDEQELLARDAQLRHELLHGREDRVVPAAGAPPDLLVRDEVLAGELRERLGLVTVTSSPSACRRTILTSSLTWKGRPATLFTPSASTRYFARTRSRSCPRFSSGTRTFLKRLRMSPRFFGKGFM
jgi:hypothetical protein